jgi:hypothetical protein
MQNSALKHGIAFGLLFGGVSTLFTLISILIPLEYATWRVLFNINGVTLFALCGAAEMRAALHTGKVLTATVAGIVAGVIGSLIYTLATWVLPYILFDYLAGYPFLYLDFTHTGMPDIKTYLLSPKGYWGVVGTTVGFLPFILPIAVALGGALGAAGGLLIKVWARFRATAPR